MSFTVRESVRGIVEYILQSGSIDDRHVSRTRAIEGTMAHTKLQDDNSNVYEDYQKEVSLNCEFVYDDITLYLEGRADGIIKENNSVIIEEIKSTYRDLIYIDEEYNPLHWAQCKFYGYIYCKDNNINEITIMVSYYNLNTNEVKSLRRIYTYEELKTFVFDIVDKYMITIRLRENFRVERDKSIEKINFPFSTYRKGQKELAINCFNTVKQKGILFAQAPTGIGKTISTIFPAVKSLGQGRGQRIIYLTSKTITRTVAEEAYGRLMNGGLVFRLVTLTAKDKICFKDEAKCNPDDCPYALDYYSKINDVINEMLQEEKIFSRQIIEEYAKKYTICPFELSLDLTLWCDGIICDYNYAFDPRARLKRIFEEDNQKNIILVDEAHNLVSRGRDMYSGELNKTNVLEISRLIKGKVPNLYKVVNNINKELIEIRRELEANDTNVLYHNVQYKELVKLLRIFIAEADEYLIKSKNTSGYEQVRDFYFEARNFIALSELYSDQYTTILKKDKNDFIVKIFCIDPSKNLGAVIKSSYAALIFSATLSPIKYYIDLLVGEHEPYRVRYSSPFKKEHLQTSVYPLDMRYVNRDKNIEKLCEIIRNFTSDQKGNYIIFLPSFLYMRKVYEKYVELFPEEYIIVQEEGMTELEKEEFLQKFQSDSNVTAFAVVGGMFSEGVDLPGDRLIGVVIIGVGFPMISIENDIIVNYFEDKGFDYAYTYPGINKILQAAGRVIRTETDKGRVLLVDKRYMSNRYKNMLPEEWETTVIDNR